MLLVNATHKQNVEMLLAYHLTVKKKQLKTVLNNLLLLLLWKVNGAVRAMTAT